MQQQKYAVLAQRSGSGLTTPAIAGITAASVVVAMLLAGLVLVFRRRRRAQKSMPPFNPIEVADLRNQFVRAPLLADLYEVVY